VKRVRDSAPSAARSNDNAPSALRSNDSASSAARTRQRVKHSASSHASGANVDTHALLALRAFEEKLGLVARAARLLPAITARNAAGERLRLQAVLEAGELPLPHFEYANPKPCRASLRWLDQLRGEAKRLPASALYLDKLEELELDVALLGSLGDARLVRPLAARRFGTGDELVALEDGPVSLFDYSRRLLLGHVVRRPQRPSIPPDASDGVQSLRAIIERVASAAGLQVSVRVEPNLTAGAATGERTVYVADRLFGAREAWRLALHEVLGHLTSAANGSAQPLRLLEWGTASSFADQEGVALCIEAEFGFLDRGRLRSLAGRVLATRFMHAGASFGETARTLFREQGFAAAESIAITERAYRGGGVARDAGYLLGFMRVREAVRSGQTTLDELRMGRVGVSSLPEIRELMRAGLVRPAIHRPNLSRSCFSTSSGTMP
jgi:uncharacterized protein (TIGR02421 family)